VAKSTFLFVAACCWCASGSLAFSQNPSGEPKSVPTCRSAGTNRSKGSPCGDPIHLPDGRHIVGFPSVRARFWLVQAIQDAARRLGTLECRRVLSDFTDTSGNPVETNLIRLAVEPADYVLGFV
jgi:hypothetical protein